MRSNSTDAHKWMASVKAHLNESNFDSYLHIWQLLFFKCSLYLYLPYIFICFVKFSTHFIQSLSFSSMLVA